MSAAYVVVFLPDHDHFYFSLYIFFLDKAYQGLLSDYSLKKQILSVCFFVIFIVSFLFNLYLFYVVQFIVFLPFIIMVGSYSYFQNG